MANEGSSGTLALVDSAEFLPVAGKLRGDFSYRLIEGITLNGQKLEHSLWTGAVLRRCQFTNVSFDRCDFAGTKFIDCEFIGCSFEPDELRSCFLNRVRFERCALVGLQCVSSQFRDCAFLDCDMRRSSIRECQFLDCVLEDIPLRGCSITLNLYERSVFRRVIFADATILFLIFDCCAFEECTMNAETIGFTFGLRREDLDSFELVYLGEPQDRPAEGELLTALLETYEARKWILGVCLLKLNFGVEASYLALREFARGLVAMVAQEPRVDWDELGFLAMVLERLQERGELPFMGIWEVNAAVISTIAALEHEPSGLAVVPPAQNIAWRLRRIATQRMTEITGDLLIAGDPRETVELQIVLTRPPLVGLDEIIPSELKATVGAGPSDLELVRSWEGSWHEIWQLSLAGLAALNVTLVLIDTSWERAAKIWKRGKLARAALKRKKQPAEAELPSAELVTERPTVPAGNLGIDLPTIAAAVERASAELRAITDADRDALIRLDLAVQRIGLLSDPLVRRLLDYAAPTMRSVQLVTGR